MPAIIQTVYFANDDKEIARVKTAVPHKKGDVVMIGSKKFKVEEVWYEVDTSDNSVQIDVFVERAE